MADQPQTFTRDVIFDGDVTFNGGVSGISVAWNDIDFTVSDIADITTKSHTSLTDIGTNTHAQIDTHIADVANPHATDVANLGSGTLAELNANITDATLDDSGDSRTPSGTAGGDLNGTYPNPSVDDGADATAIHDNVDGEINAIASKATPVGADVIVIEDSAASFAKKKTLISDLPTGTSLPVVDTTSIVEGSVDDTKEFRMEVDGITTGTVRVGTIPDKDFTFGLDDDAIHDNVAAEISVVTEKVTPAAGDWLLIEDAADSNNKKRVNVTNLPTGGGGEANTSSNSGTGADIAQTKAGIDLPFRSLLSSDSSLTVTENTDDIDHIINKDIVNQITENPETGTTYTLVLADADRKSVNIANAASNVITVPTNASVAYPTNTVIDISQTGAGETTITGDTGVTINGVSAGSVVIQNQYGSCRLVKIGTNTWLASGDLFAGGGGAIDWGGTQLGEVIIATDGDIPDFSSIPTGYDSIEIHYHSQRDNASDGLLYISINGDTTTSNYQRQAFYAEDGAVASAEASDNVMGFSAGNTAGQISTGIIRIMDYDGTRDKMVQNTFSNKSNDTSSVTGVFATARNDTEAVNQIELDDNSSMTGSGFLEDDVFTLIGFKKQ